MATPTSSLIDVSLAMLLATGKWSDLTIICRGRPFRVHFCSQSKTIADMCDSPMIEGKSGVMKHEEFDAETMWCAIYFAYNKVYEIMRRPEGLEEEDTEENEEAEQDGEAPQQVETTADGHATPLTEDSQEAEGVVVPVDNDTTTPNNEDPTELSHIDKWITHVRVYALADYYSMPELRAYALSRFRGVADEMPTWTTCPVSSPLSKKSAN